VVTYKQIAISGGYNCADCAQEAMYRIGEFERNLTDSCPTDKVRRFLDALDDESFSVGEHKVRGFTGGE
jgi:hypothetical protein